MVIAQVTDLHVLPPGATLGGLDTNAMCARAVEHLGRLVPAPDVVLFTGDLSEDGSPASYRLLRETLAHLRIPYYLIVGNHDRRGPVREAFPDHEYLPRSGFLQYVLEQYPVRLVGLDTLDDGQDGGRLCDARLDWLDRTLGDAPDRATLLFMHHPPFESGIRWMDAAGFRGADEFESVVSRHRQVKRVVCGHLHRPISSAVGGVHTSVAPSTCYQVHLDLAATASPHIILEPPACHLHIWTGSRLVTHESYICCPEPAIDLGRPTASP